MREPPPPRSRRRRIARATGLTVLALCLLAAVVVFVATRSFALRAIVEPRLADALGAEVSVGRASLSGFSTLTLRRVVGVAPGVATEAGEVLTVDRLDASLDWGAILAGRFGVREVRFDAPTLRLSQRAGTPTLNLANLSPRPGGTGPVELPRVTVRGGRVEFGEHDDARYTALASIEVDGVLERSPGDRSVYQIALVETASSAQERVPRDPVAITLEGLYDPVRVEGRLILENVDLQSWGPAAAPSDVRDLWERLRLEGEVERTEFVYSERDGVLVEFHFTDVALRLPIAADPQSDIEFNPGPRDDPERLMRVSDASGSAILGANGMHAQITGMIEDLPYRVRLDTTSLALDSAFTIRFDTAEPFQVAQRPQLLPFAPPVVRRRLESFSSPTAMMEASVEVSRAEATGGVAAPLSISGVLLFSEGTASFTEFPYPVYDMTARVRFDEEAVVIEEMTGRGATGATMQVRGIISPPSDGAMVDIRIRFDDLPLDEAFDDAMPSSRAGLIGAIFNRPAEQRLREAGLLPEGFALGGVGSLEIRVLRPLGEDSRYDWAALFTLPRAGLLVERFPLPAIVEDATIEVTSDWAEVRIATVRGVSGGEGDLTASIVLRAGEESVFLPTISVRTLGTPIDERLLAALPGGAGLPAPSGDDGVDRFNASEAIRELGLRGQADAIARVLPRDDGSLGFDVFLEFNDVDAFPGGAEAPLLTDLAGRLSVSEASLELSGLQGRLDASPFTLDGRLGIAGGALGAVDLRMGVEALDLSSRFETLLAPFARETAESLRAGMEAVSLRGEVDARVALRTADEGGADRIAATIEIPRIHAIEFDALGGRVALSNAEGDVTIDASRAGATVASFRAVSADASFDGEAPVRVSLDGGFDASFLRESPPQPAESAERVLRVDADLLWPSALARALARTAAPERFEAIDRALEQWGVRARADAGAVVRTAPGERPAIGEVMISPHWVGLSRDGREMEFDVLRGRVVRRDETLLLRDFEIESDRVSMRFDGDSVLGEAPSLNLELSGEIRGVDETVIAFLPGGAGEALRTAAFRAERVLIDRAELAIAPALGSTLLSAGVRYRGVSFDVGGTDVSGLDGSLAVQIDTADPRPLDATLRFDSARVQRLRLGKGEARVLASEGGSSFLVPQFEADAYGGRITGIGKVTRRPRSATTDSRAIEYQVEGQFGGVSLPGLRSDLGVGGDEASSGEPDAGAGQIDATIAVAGVIGQPMSRVGRGAVRLWGGEVLRFPLISRLIELSNLQLPTGEQLDFAHSRFYIEGDRVLFEELGLASDSVTLAGQGSLQWPSLNLDLRVTSRAARRAPLLSDLLEAFRDELVTIRVSGPLPDPRFSVESLPTTRRFLDSIFGGRKDADSRQRPPAQPIRARDASANDR